MERWLPENCAVIISQVYLLNVSRNNTALSRNDVEFTRSLGRGWFGWVLECKIKDRLIINDDGHVEESCNAGIAQVLKEKSNSQEKLIFFEEGFGYSTANHENVLNLRTVFSEEAPFIHIFELCNLGNAKTYLSQRAGICKIFHPYH